MTTSGAELPADVVVVGIGAVPNDGLAKSAGLDVNNGVVTDSALRTSDPDIFAAGDVASSYLPLLGRHLRVDHWSNALNGGKAAAQSMLGQQIEYNRVPYFYSDQYDLGMECAGLPFPGTYDQVVYRGDADALEFIAFWLKEGRLVAGMNVNVWDVNDDLQGLIRSAKPLDPARLSDPAIPLLRGLTPPAAQVPSRSLGPRVGCPTQPRHPHGRPSRPSLCPPRPLQASMPRLMVAPGPSGPSRRARPRRQAVHRRPGRPGPRPGLAVSPVPRPSTVREDSP